MRLLYQLLKFGCVGLLATVLHYLIAVTMIEFMVWPLWANFFADCALVCGSRHVCAESVLGL